MTLISSCSSYLLLCNKLFQNLVVSNDRNNLIFVPFIILGVIGLSVAGLTWDVHQVVSGQIMTVPRLSLSSLSHVSGG